jgi:pimeloyl-ACP methyl ester carboxylesterase
MYRGVTQDIGPALHAHPAFRQLVLIAEAGHWVQFEQASAFDVVLASMLAG